MNYYSVSFYLGQDKYLEISSVLGLDFEWDNQTGRFEFNSDFKENYWTCLNRILDLIEIKSDKLESLGIKKESISIWFISEMSEQTNFEFPPNLLEKLGKSGVYFCISLY